MSDHQRIKARRLELGLSETTVAERVGIGIHAYCDVEQHADEFRSGIDLGTARALCKVLDLDLEELLGFTAESAADTSRVLGIHSRHELIRRSRETAGLSRNEVADNLGFDESTIETLESDSSAIDRYPIEFLIGLADLLRLAPSELLR